MFIADARNDPQWCDKVDSVDQVAGRVRDPTPVTGCSTGRFAYGRPKELAVTVEEYEAPRLLRLREEDDDAVFEVT